MEPHPVSTEAFAAHRLLLQPGLGSATALGLFRTLGSFERAFSAPLAEIPERWRALLRDCRGADDGAARAALASLREQNIFLRCLTDPGYPTLLREIPAPPPLLYGCGDPEALALPAIAMVGSRNASRGGVEHAQHLAETLAGNGFAIASGLALGIDSAAHRGALRAGVTVAVVGTGIDRVYPRQNLGLWRDIVAAGGAVVTEFPPGTAPLAGNFPRRNRIISGLSLGVLVVEAALHSGSLITARQALEQGREVFAIPGSIDNPRARGCHQLIRDGATLVETAADIVAQLGGMLALKRVEARGGEARTPVALSAEAGRVLAALGHDPADADRLVALTGLPVAAVTAALVELELSGLVDARDGSYCRLG